MDSPFKMGLSFKTTPKLNFTQFCPSDYNFADQLLNFPNDEEDESIEKEEEEEEIKPQNSPVSAPLFLQLQNDPTSNSNSNSNSKEQDFLFVSSNDFEDLEWLSHLVADSTQEQYSATGPCSVFSTQNHKPIHFHEFGSNLKIPFPSKPRTKRTKLSGRVWSLSASISSPSAKKPKDGFGRVQPSRRCGHCGVQKTPQWRAGPLGAKTLCNACGVRFKSGRLFPEYRPACSPSFLSGVHSNHHRRVLEMRRKKETENWEDSGLE